VRFSAIFGAMLACGAAQHAEGDAGLPDGVRIDRIEVDKSDREMKVFSRGRLVHTYRVAIGVGGMGPKRHEGDGVTPEGEYRIDSRHRSRSWHRFLHVSYPNARDRRRYRRGVASGEIPEVGVGGAIGIHGGNHGLLRMADWTAGCIAVTDEEAEELFRAVRPNARIVITE